jgi:hypothetical protein
MMQEQAVGHYIDTIICKRHAERIGCQPFRPGQACRPSCIHARKVLRTAIQQRNPHLFPRPMQFRSRRTQYIRAPAGYLKQMKTRTHWHTRNRPLQQPAMHPVPAKQAVHPLQRPER